MAPNHHNYQSTPSEWVSLAAKGLLSLLLALSQVEGNAAQPVAIVEESSAVERVAAGQQLLYDFRTLESGVIRDLSGGEYSLNLTVREPWSLKSDPAGLIVSGKSSITTEAAAGGLTAVLQQSGAFSIEVWARPQSLTQSGPARLVTLSRDSSQRNFTLGQDGDKLDFRLRTTATNGNGIPSLTSKGGVVQAGMMHIVCTHSRSGKTYIYVNGQQVAEQQLKGDISNWSKDYRLGIANELSGERPWEGSILMVAIFNRDLSYEEVRRNYEAGLPNSAAKVKLTHADVNARYFETEVAPILARHCLECHDTSTQQGGLDLSRREKAFAGGDSDTALIAGNSGDSRFWQLVETDEMPHDRTPLSDDEKFVLKKWIDDGADWRLEVIDPAIYVHGQSSKSVFVQRLTVPEYIETIRSLFGVDVSEAAKEILPADLRADGFSNTAYNLTIDLAHVEAYMKLAELVTDRIDAAALAKRFTKSREMTDENLVKFIGPLGRLVLRSPLSERERLSFLGVSTSVAAAGGDFDEMIRYVVAAMLQSPRFLYRIETQRGDGTAWPINSYELATRLSYILWGGPPDEALLEAAENNDLSGDALKERVALMLQDDRAIRRSKQFISEWLNLGHLKNLQPDADRFPEWTPELADDMRAETLAYFEEIVWTQRRPLADLLNAQVTIATPRLARYYNLPLADAEPGAKGDVEPLRFDLSNVKSRGGLLTQGSTLTIGGDDASMVTRGLFVMHEFLRGVVKDPPPCVDVTPVPSQPGLTQRTIAERRLSSASCSGCHSKFEPLSFGLERFDGLGAYREVDEFDNVLHEFGTILFPGQAEPKNYQTSSELMDLLAESERVKESITWKIAQFAVARPLGASDASTMAEIHQQSQLAGGRWTDVMTAIVLSDLVQLTQTEPDSN